MHQQQGHIWRLFKGMYLQVNGVHCSAGPNTLCHEQSVMAVATRCVHCHITRLQHLQGAAVMFCQAASIMD
jgi:hypothetical protein